MKQSGFALFSFLVAIVILTGAITYVVYGDPSSPAKRMESVEKVTISKSIISQAETLINILSMCSLGEKRYASGMNTGSLNPSDYGESSIYPNSPSGDTFPQGIPIDYNNANGISCGASETNVETQLHIPGSPIIVPINDLEPLFNSSIDDSGDYIVKIPGFKSWVYYPEEDKVSIYIETEPGGASESIKSNALERAAAHFGNLAQISGSPVNRITILVIEN